MLRKHVWAGIASRYVSQHVVAVRTLLSSGGRRSSSPSTCRPPPAPSRSRTYTYDMLESWLLHNAADFVSVAGDWNLELEQGASAVASGSNGTGSRAMWRMPAMHDFCIRVGL